MKDSIRNNVVSIIVPVYNAEQYLDKCIKSIQNQTYTNIEIILVNDGSTDNSLNICRNYSAKDIRIVVVDKTNGGVSSARNCGIEKARGEFCCFIDSDDWIEKTHIERMVRGIADVDCLIIGYTKETDDSIIHCKLASYECNLNDLDGKKVESLFVNGYIHPCWNKMFKTQIIHKFCLKFDEQIHISEDSLFCLDYLQYCSTVKILDIFTYHYHIEAADTSLSKKVYSDIFDIYSEVYNRLEKLLVRCACKKEMREQILIKTIYPQLYSSVIKILRDKGKTKIEKNQMLDKMNSMMYCKNVLAGAVYISENKIERIMLKLIIKRQYRLLEAIWQWGIK